MPSQLRALWTAMAVVVAALVGVVTVLLRTADGAKIPGAILTGGAAASGMMTLLIVVATFALRK